MVENGKRMRPWHFGNTSVRSPFRFFDGLTALANSPLQGDLHGRESERRFRDLLGKAGVVDLREDHTDSVARKWRSALSQLGFLYPDLSKTNVPAWQEELGDCDCITPNGWRLLETDRNVPAMQDCFLRSLTAYAIPSPVEPDYEGRSFRPLSMVLAIMLELERFSGDTFLSFAELGVFVSMTRAKDLPEKVAEKIIQSRAKNREGMTPAAFQRRLFAEAGVKFGYVEQTFRDYADLNSRYLKATGLVQARGRGIELSPAKRRVAVEIGRKPTCVPRSVEYFANLCRGSRLPTDNSEIASRVLADLQASLAEVGIEPPLATTDDVRDMAVARHACESLLMEAKEIEYAARQEQEWKDIVGYMDALNSNRRNAGRSTIPNGEAPAYLEWILWRAFLAIDSLVNPPYQARRFKVSPEFLPLATAPGGGPDMIFEFAEFIVVVEVTLTQGSRQEAAEGEPVRRHIGDIVAKSDKPVFGLFVAPRIDRNTAETFRHGLWYFSNDDCSRLDIVPLRLDVFKDFFASLFDGTANDRPLRLRKLLELGASHGLRDICAAPDWEERIVAQIRFPTDS